MVDRLKSTSSLLQELEAALRIDEYALSDVAREHPVFFHRVAREVALAISRRDAAKVELERIEGQITLYMREQARDDGEKTTVDEIKARVRENKQYVTVADQMALRSDQVGEWSALKESYLQRSYMIKALVDLYLGKYYATTERREDTDERADAARARMKEMRLRDQSRE